MYNRSSECSVAPPCTCQTAKYNDPAPMYPSITNNNPCYMQPYSSLRASSFLLSISSLALVFLPPHLDLSASSFCLSSSFFSSGASQHIFTKNIEQLNFLANFAADHWKGSDVRNLCISVMSASVRWCLTPMGLNFAITGGSGAFVVRAAVGARICFRLSSFGRNMRGVCRTDGADEGGLKIM